MDEVKLASNQRFDLLDMTRFKSRLQEAFGDVLSRVLGLPNYYSGAARDFSKRPLPSYMPRITKVGTPSLVLQVDQQWNDGTNDLEAHLYDKDGMRLTGPNSVMTKTITVDAIPGSTYRFIVARRLPVDGNNEVRHFYTSTAGHYTAATDTTTDDDWEIAETLPKGTLPTTDPGYAADGWILIARFQTNGADDVTVLAPYPPFMDTEPLTWSAAGGDPDYYEQSLGEAVVALGQILSRLRGGSFEWRHDPNYDGAFEREGGFRFAAGLTAGAGLQDTFLRALAGSGSYDQITATSGAPIDPDDLLHIRAQSFIAGGATGSGAPDPSNNRGYCYSANEDGIAAGLSEVSKYISIDASQMNPCVGVSYQHPRQSPIVLNDWYFSSAPGTVGDDNSGINSYDHNQGWSCEFAAGSAIDGANPLFMPFNPPHGVKLGTCFVSLYSNGGLDNGMGNIVVLDLVLIRRRYDLQGGSGTVDIIAGPGAGWHDNNVAGNYEDLTVTPSDPATWITDCNQYAYYLVLTFGCGGDTGGGRDHIRVTRACVEYIIREASHVY